MTSEASGGLKLYNFLFEAHLNYVEIAINFDCSLQVLWKRGTQKIQTESSSKLDSSQGRAYFNEILKMNSTMYYDEAKQQFLEKKSQFTIVFVTEKGSKIAGQCQIDLANYVINQINTQEETIALSKCPDQNAKLNFIMRVKYIGEGAAAEIPISMESIASIKSTATKPKIQSSQSHASNNNNTTELEKENSKLKSENKELLNNIQRLKSEQNQNSNNNNEWEKKYKELHAKALAQENELQVQKQQIAEKDQQLVELAEEYNLVKNQLQEQQGQQIQQQGQNQNQNSNQKQNQLHIQLQMLQEENSRIKKSLEMLKINPGTEDETYEIKTFELDELIGNVQELQEENEQQSLKIQKLQKYQTQAQVKMSDQMKEISALQEQLVKNKQIIGDTINFVAANSNQEFLQEMMQQIKLS